MIRTVEGAPIGIGKVVGSLEDVSAALPYCCHNYFRTCL